MTDAEILTNTKIDLEISGTSRDTFLENLITSAKAAINLEGITLEDTVPDGMLVASYAAYLYRKRKDDVTGMPRHLRYLLNNRLLAEKGRSDT